MLIQLNEEEQEFLCKEISKKNKADDLVLKIFKYITIVMSLTFILLASPIIKVLVIGMDLLMAFIWRKTIEVERLCRQNVEKHLEHKTYLVDKRNDYELLTETSTHTDSDGDRNTHVTYKVSLLTELGEVQANIPKQLYTKNKLKKDDLYFIWIDKEQFEEPTHLYDNKLKEIRVPYMVLGSLRVEVNG